MTVEKWLRGKFQGVGTQIDKNVLEVAALSPLEARPRAFRAVALSEEVDDFLGDVDLMNGLKYALSTLYYAMSAAVTGGNRSESRGNRSATVGGYPLTTADREAFRAEAERLRRELGCESQERTSGKSGAYDASRLCNRKPNMMR